MKNSEPEANPSDSDQTTDQTYLGKNVKMMGTLRYPGAVRIDGRLEGEIHTQGILEVGKNALIRANIETDSLVSTGRILGDVVAKTRVELIAPAQMQGSVTAPVIVVEEGVQLNGALQNTGNTEGNS